MKASTPAIAALAALAFLHCALPASAGTTKYVGGENASDDNDGSANAPYATLEKAFLELQNKTGSADWGHKIVVRRGTYRVTNPTFMNRRDLSLYGETGNPADVVISGGGENAIITTSHNMGGNGNEICHITFENGGASVSAVTMKANNMVVSNCVFRNNLGRGLYIVPDGTPASPNTIVDCVFEDNGDGSMIGGACNVPLSTIRRCVFRRNKGAAGGAIMAGVLNSNGQLYFNDTYKAHVEDCSFTDNFAVTVGGAFCGLVTNGIMNCTFHGNSVSNDFTNTSLLGTNSCVARGGAVALFRGTNGSLLDYPQVVSNCTFTANVAYGQFGSAILGRNVNMEIYDCTFSANTQAVSKVTAQGGAIASSHLTGAGTTSTNLVERCVFDGNVGATGPGAVATPGSTKLTLRDCLFVNNRNEANQGGAMSSSYALRAENCTFARNYAATYGGGIALKATAAYGSGITNCLFVLNEAGAPSTYAKGGVNVGWDDTGSSWSTRVAAFYNCMEVVTQSQYDAGLNSSGTPAALSLNQGLTTYQDKVNAGTLADYFADAAKGDYTPVKRSPARNAALDLAWMADATDLAGNARINAEDLVAGAALPDLGCYEWYDPYAHKPTVLSIR